MNELTLLNPQNLMNVFNETDLVSFKMQRELIPTQREISGSINKDGVTLTYRTSKIIRESIVIERKKNNNVL